MWVILVGGGIWTLLSLVLLLPQSSDSEEEVVEVNQLSEITKCNSLQKLYLVLSIADVTTKKEGRKRLKERLEYMPRDYNISKYTLPHFSSDKRVCSDMRSKLFWLLFTLQIYQLLPCSPTKIISIILVPPIFTQMTSTYCILPIITPPPLFDLQVPFTSIFTPLISPHPYV